MRRRNDLTWLMRTVTAASLACLALEVRAQTAVPIRTPVAVPWLIADDDFGRHRDPAEWRGLEVQRIDLVESGVTWRLFRIASREKPAGPLWMVLHDNENAAFDAGLEAVRSWGGVMMVVDTDPLGTSYQARFNHRVAYGEPVDPNRHFDDTAPLYVLTMLADLGSRPIVALHTNAYGYDGTLSDCGVPRGGDTGSGEISVLLCNAGHLPRPAAVARWPFDDPDTLALLPYPRGADAQAAFCSKRLVARDFNLVYEAEQSDGSLSNYAALRRLRYVNLETRERGFDSIGIAAARDRLVAMIDIVMQECVAIPAARIDPSTKPPAPPPRSAKAQGHRR